MKYADLPAAEYLGTASNPAALMVLLHRVTPTVYDDYFKKFSPVQGMPFSLRLLLPFLEAPEGEYFAPLSSLTVHEVAEEFFSSRFVPEVRRVAAPTERVQPAWSVYKLLYCGKNAALVNATWCD
ncbi:hypothetical protein EBR66_04205 [bacterium]|nr:hypothetical protein [bacterium]